jgi:uncharacterized protein YegL
MTTLKEFTHSAPRPLPVIVLADVSGSMSPEGKIGALNQAIRDMITSFVNEEDMRAQIQVSVITFGGTAKVHAELQPAKAIQWADMNADGGTPMGEAMSLAAALIEDKSKVPSRAYRPTVVLVSDGLPTDDWKAGFDKLLTSERAKKSDRFAMAIGADADEAMLEQFMSDPKIGVFRANDAAQIRQFFRFVTMSVTSRTRSQNPNATQQLPPIDNPDDIKI